MTLPIPTKPIEKKEPSRSHSLVPAAVALAAIVVVCGYMVYDNYQREHQPPQPPPDVNAYAGGVDAESDFLIHSFQGQPMASELMVQPGDRPLEGEPLHFPSPAGRATRENAFRRQLSGITEEVSVWTVPDQTVVKLAETYRKFALDSGMDQLPSPNSVPLGPSDPGRHPEASAQGQTRPAASQSSESQPSAGRGRGMNLRFLRRPTFPSQTQAAYSPAAVLFVRVRPLEAGGSRLFLWARYSSPPTPPEPDTNPDSDGATSRP